MPVEEVKAYKTSDGKVFGHAVDAHHHELRCALLKLAGFDEPVMGTYAGSVADAEELVEWLERNAKLVTDYLHQVKLLKIKSS